MFKRIVSLTLSLGLLLQQTVFAYTTNLNLSNYLNSGANLTALDRFRPISLRYFSYQPQTNDFKVLLDKGDYAKSSGHQDTKSPEKEDSVLKEAAKELMDYFKIGLSLPNDKFWVNLRPDSEDEIIDEELAKTDLGKVMLEADLKLKQDTSLFTSPQSPQGKEYWNRLYKKAGELFGTENITIPTLTRPWIVPGEIILRESADKDNQASGAYIYKANLKVMLEEDYLRSQGHKVTKSQGDKVTKSLVNQTEYSFNDPRLKELNQYSTQLIRELILPRLTQKVNSSKDYANLRQVYFSLILARWFKEAFSPQSTVHSPQNNDSYIKLIDSNNLTNLTSKTPWDKTTYFNSYQKSFQEGEYNLSEPIYTPTGQVIRRYMSGGMLISPDLKANGAGIYAGGPDSIVSSAIMTSETQVFFTEKELSQKQFIDSKKRVLDIFYPIDSGLANLTEYALKFNDILGFNKSILNEEEKTSMDNLLKRIREKKEQVKAVKDELMVIPEGAAEPLTSLGAAWKILNRTQVFLIDEAKNLLKITNSIQSLIGYENGEYSNLRKEALETIIKHLSGQALFRSEIISRRPNLIARLHKMENETEVVNARCLLSYSNGKTNNINISVKFYRDGDVSLFPAHDAKNKILDPILKFNLDWSKLTEVEMSNRFWEYKINNLSPEGAYNLVGAIEDALERANNASSAMEASKETEGPAIISAVKGLQDKLPDDGNEQLLKFAANVNPNGELEYPIKKDDNVMIGHVRGDRAWYLARGLQEMGFSKLLGYIKFNKDFKGVSVLPEEAVGKISNTFFEKISGLGYTSVKISEDEKKEHTGYNANGRNEQPFPGERRVVIKMQKSSKAYVDTPEMRMKEVADAVLTELDGNVDFILTNFLSSDMMKHTGNFEAAKKSNEISDQQLGRIKERIDAIKEAVLEEMQDAVNYRIPESEEKIHLLRLLTDNYDKFLKIVSKKYSDVLYTIKMLEKEIPLFVITADHGASEEGLKENPKESDTFHSANPVPYIIYDPLRKQKIPLKESKTIRNNAATLLQLLGEEVPKEYDESLLPADYQGSKRRVVFAVLDGWGINPNQKYSHDAIRLADTPNYDWFVKNASFAKLEARGEVIGLRKMLSYEEGPHHLRGLQAGQTDIGHIHLFSGREVKQPLWYVDQLIQGGLSNGVFDETKEEVKLLIRELNEVKEKGSKFNYITVGSEGGVHASLYHMYALMRLAKKVGLEKDQFVIHFAADGRDVPTCTAHLYLEDVYKRIDEIGIGVVSVVFGRDMLVRKDGAENITNRLINVLSGENLKDDDVTLVKKTSESEDNSNAIIRNLQKVYNRIAPEYSDIWGDDVQEEVKRHREAFLEIIPKNAAVVDAGTGPGRDTAWFSDHGLRAIGIDFSKEMIAQAQKRHPALEFQQMDMRRLEFESSNIDGIWDNGAFHHLPPDAARQAFKEFYRVLKSDGVLFLRVKQGDGEVLQPDKKYPDETRYFKLYQKDELENLAAFQGFEIIKSGTEIDSKKPEQTWVYLFAKKVSSTGSPLTVKEFTQELNNIPKKEESFADAFLRLIEMASRLSEREEILEDIQEKIYATISRISKEEAKYILREKESSVRQARTIGSILTIIENGLSAHKVSEEIKLKLIKAIEEALINHPEYPGHKQNVDDVITAIKAGYIKTGEIKGFVEHEIMSYPSMKNMINFEKGLIGELLEKDERADAFSASIKKARKTIAEQNETSLNQMLMNDVTRKSLFDAIVWDMLIKEERINELEKILDEQMGRMNKYFISDLIKNFPDKFKKARRKDKKDILDSILDNSKNKNISVSLNEQKERNELRDFLAQCLRSYYLKAAQEVMENKQEATNTAKKVIQFLSNPNSERYFYRELSTVASAWNKMKGSSSALTALERTLPEVVGGIDFRQMNMLIRPQGSFASSSLDFSLPALSKAEIESFDLDTELAAIQRMASSGIAPSYQRLKEYLAVCFAKERTGKDIDNLKLCLLDIFEKEQFEAKETPDGYKEVLVIADTKGYVLRESRLAVRGQNSYSLN